MLPCSRYLVDYLEIARLLFGWLLISRRQLYLWKSVCVCKRMKKFRVNAFINQSFLFLGFFLEGGSSGGKRSSGFSVNTLVTSLNFAADRSAKLTCSAISRCRYLFSNSFFLNSLTLIWKHINDKFFTHLSKIICFITLCLFPLVSSRIRVSEKQTIFDANSLSGQSLHAATSASKTTFNGGRVIWMDIIRQSVGLWQWVLTCSYIIGGSFAIFIVIEHCLRDVLNSRVSMHRIFNSCKEILI